LCNFYRAARVTTLHCGTNAAIRAATCCEADEAARTNLVYSHNTIVRNVIA